MTYIAIPTKAAQLVRVEIKEEDKVFVATSPDLNIVITGHNLGDEFHEGIKRAIRDNFSAMGQTPPMTVIRVNHPDRGTGYWHFAAIPAGFTDELNVAENNRRFYWRKSTDPVGTEHYDDLSELMAYEDADWCVSVPVTKVAEVQTGFAVRIPIHDSEGELEGEEFQIFNSEEEAKRFIEDITSVDNAQERAGGDPIGAA